MDYRGVLLIAAIVGAGALASSTACSGPDPGAITFAERQSQGTSETQSSSGTSGTGGDGGSSGTAPTTDPVFGTTAFAYEDPGVEANKANDAHGGSVEGRNCADTGCHTEGGAAAGKQWLFAGTVYTAPTNGQTVPKAEIKMVGPNGEEIGSAYTDKNGNFWLEKAGPIPAGSKVGVRKEGGKATHMVATLGPGDGGCSANKLNCHGTAQGRVWAP